MEAAMAKTPSRETRKLVFPKGMNPKDWLRFIQEDLFERCWNALNLTDEDLQALETLVMLNPDGQPVLKGTGGVRKIRFAGNHWDKGKRGGARVYYLYIPDKGLVIWLFVHLKSDQESLSEKGKKEIRSLVKEVLSILEQGGYDLG
jgi:hypothetical protein